MKQRPALPRLLRLLSCLLLPSLAAGPALAQETVGYVKTVSGEASVTTAGHAVKAMVGTPVALGSVVKTGKDGALGITLRDETVMSFGPGSELTLDEYLYAPAQGKLKMNTRLTKGTLNYVSGVIAKLNPQGVNVTTSAGVIGVRGTHFAVKVEE